MGVGAKEEVEILAAPMGPPAPAPPRTKPVHAPVLENRVRAAYAVPVPQPTAEPGARRRASAEPVPRPQPVAQARPQTRVQAPASAPAPVPAPRQEAPAPASELMQVRRRQPISVAEAVAPVARIAVRPAAPHVPAAPQASGPSSTANLHEDVGAIKAMVAKLLASGVAAPVVRAGPGEHDPLAAWYLRLLSNAVSSELAERIVADVRRRIGSEISNEEAVRLAFRECIASHIHTAQDPVRLPRMGEPCPRAIALVGATGVGKTTTIAKLAAQVKLNQGARVGVITCDTNRVGAIEQLRTYADIVGVPFRVRGAPRRCARRGGASPTST